MGSVKTTNVSETVDDSLNNNHIPKDIEGCIVLLDSMLDDSTKMEIKEMSKSSFSAEAHLGLGLWIRNNWGLWKGGSLATYFNELGVYHPDEISGIILNCYYNHLKDLDIDLKGEVEKDRLFGLMMETPNINSYPKGVSSKIQFDNSFIYENVDDDLEGVLHIGKDAESKIYWAYDYNFGWRKIDLRTFNKLKDSKPDTRYNIVKSIFND